MGSCSPLQPSRAQRLEGNGQKEIESGECSTQYANITAVWKDWVIVTIFN